MTFGGATRIEVEIGHLKMMTNDHPFFTKLSRNGIAKINLKKQELIGGHCRTPTQTMHYYKVNSSN